MITYKSLFQIGTFLLITHSVLVGQVNYSDKTLTTHIELRKDTLLLGEPTFIDFVLNNNTTKKIYVEEGGDYRSGRKTSFDVKIVSPSGDTLKKRKLWGGMGGLVNFRKIMPSESRKFTLFLPMWGTIEEEGTYQLIISKNFLISPTSSYYRYPKKLFQKSTATFQVVKDDARLGDFITELTESFEKTIGLLETKEARSNFLLHTDLNRRLSENKRIVSEIHDERIVPFLVENVKQETYFERGKAADLLIKFPKNDLVFETFKLLAQLPSNTKSQVFEDSISYKSSSSDLRQKALSGIMRHKNEAKVDFLISRKHNSLPEERYHIIHVAKYYLVREDLLKIYHAFLDDEHLAVRQKAQEELETYQQITVLKSLFSSYELAPSFSVWKALSYWINKFQHYSK